MGHIGDIGRGRGRHGFGEGTRVGPAPSRDSPHGGATSEGAPGGGEGTGTSSEGGGSPRTGERPAVRTGERGALRSGDTSARSSPDSPAPRTGERPALRTGDGSSPRTGERQALRTGDSPSPRTGERQALPDRSQSPRTATRPSLPAATFADALTTTKDGKLSTGAETLVMPKTEPLPESTTVMTRGGKTREMPALKDGKAATPDSSSDTRQGRSVQDMDTPIGRGGGTRIVRMPEALGTKGRAEAGEGGKELRQAKAPELTPKAKDGFGTTPATGNRPALATSQVKEPVLPLEELIPPSLDKLPDQEAVAMRFASDGALLRQQIRPSELPSTDRALRLWAFFTAYAEAAAGKEASPEGQEIFDKALKEQGFSELRDAASGNDGLTAAKWVLESANPDEVLDRAEQVELEPPPEVLLSESAKPQEGARKADATLPPQVAPKPEESHKSEAHVQAQAQAVPLELKDSTFSSQGIEHAPLERMPGQPDFVRLNPQQANALRPELQPQHPQLQRFEEDNSPRNSFDEAMKKLRFPMKLGNNMLWNWLHRSRNGPEDSAIEKEKWNQLVFAAMLAFVGLMLLIILVVAL